MEFVLPSWQLVVGLIIFLIFCTIPILMLILFGIKMIRKYLNK
jgi:hypothetical protein